MLFLGRSRMKSEEQAGQAKVFFENGAMFNKGHPYG